MNLTAIEAQLPEFGLRNLGAFHPKAGDFSGAKTLVLVGPAESFWRIFTSDQEYQDGLPNPIDRWSKRTIDPLAKRLGARAIYPFGGAPYAPFLSWALESRHAFSSKVGMLVHSKLGLMVSYRGALAFDEVLELPDIQHVHPCQTCETKPCLSACPVSALTPNGYDVPKCKDFLETSRGTNCMTSGCKVRRSCPLSVGAARTEAQSALHMQAFKGE